MNKLFFIVMLSLYALAVKAQDQYSDGFKVGYKKGYCYGMELECVAPIPPIPTIPRIGESSDSYQDGYNSGFSIGLDEQKKVSQKYQTTSFTDIDFIYNLNAGSILELATMQRRIKGIAFENYQNKEYNTAIFLCLRLLPSDPYDSELFMLIGECNRKQKDYQKTLYYLKKAKQYDQDNSLNLDRAINAVEKEYADSQH